MPQIRKPFANQSRDFLMRSRNLILNAIRAHNESSGSLPNNYHDNGAEEAFVKTVKAKPIWF